MSAEKLHEATQSIIPHKRQAENELLCLLMALTPGYATSELPDFLIHRMVKVFYTAATQLVVSVCSVWRCSTLAAPFPPKPSRKLSVAEGHRYI